jgi:hypothetical protein
VTPPATSAPTLLLRSGGAPSELLGKSGLDRVSVRQTVAGSDHLVNRYAGRLQVRSGPQSASTRSIDL